MTNTELHYLRQEALLLRSLTTEFHVPLTNAVGGYGEVVARRMTLDSDKWQVTDGANANRQVWVEGEWKAITSLGMDAAHPYSLDEALKVAHQVAEFEGATFEAWVRALTEVYEYECPSCCRWASWTNGRSIGAGDEVEEFWCQVCGTESPLVACERRPKKDGA